MWQLFILFPEQTTIGCNTWGCHGRPAAGLKKQSLWKRAKQENCGPGTWSCSISEFLEIRNQFCNGYAIWIRAFYELQVKSPNWEKGPLSVQNREWWCRDQGNMFLESTFQIGMLKMLFTVFGAATKTTVSRPTRWELWGGRSAAQG